VINVVQQISESWRTYPCERDSFTGPVAYRRNKKVWGIYWLQNKNLSLILATTFEQNIKLWF